MVPLGGKLYLIDRSTGARTRRSIRRAPPTIRTSRPTARSIAFVRDGDLWLVSSGARRAG